MDNSSRRKLAYKSRGSPPAWKDTFRKKCFERLRARRADFIEQCRGAELQNIPKDSIPSNKFVQDVMEEEWGALHLARKFPSLRVEMDYIVNDEDEEMMRQVIADIQKELQDEDQQLMNDILSYESGDLESKVSMFQNDDFICPICKVNKLEFRSSNVSSNVFKAPSNAFQSSSNVFGSPSNVFKSPNAYNYPSNVFQSPPNVFKSPSNAFQSSSNVFGSSNAFQSSSGFNSSNIFKSPSNVFQSSSSGFNPSSNVFNYPKCSNPSSAVSLVCSCGFTLSRPDLTMEQFRSCLQNCVSEHEKMCCSPLLFSAADDSSNANILASCSNCDWMTFLL